MWNAHLNRTFSKRHLCSGHNKNQLKSRRLSREGAVALQFDEVMNVKYGNWLELRTLFIEKS